MIETTQPVERAFLVGLDLGRKGFNVDDSLDELGSLVEAAGGRVVGRATKRRRTPDPNTYVGKGKAAELTVEIQRTAAELLVCDD